MNELDGQIDSVEIEAPLPDDLIEELIDFWEVIFETSFEDLRSVLAAAESVQNSDILYLVRHGKKLASSSHLTISKSNPELGGLGEMATAPEFRRLGLASKLCERALDDFRTQGGQALFLGTGNPAAARVYNRLGWRKLAGASVMVFIASGDSPETFLVDYFRKDGSTTTAVASASERIPMIPLLISPHDWQVLDANVGIFSTRYVVQSSCMGLYPRYEALVREGRGEWFRARTDRGNLVGLATAQLDQSTIDPRLNPSGSRDQPSIESIGTQCQVDAFTHQNYIGALEDLIQAAMSWGVSRGVPLCSATLSVEDENKRALFESLGFREAGTGEEFNLDGRRVASVRLERSAADALST